MHVQVCSIRHAAIDVLCSSIYVIGHVSVTAVGICTFWNIKFDIFLTFQVLTRFIASSSPLVYWCVAELLSDAVSMETTSDLWSFSRTVLISGRNEQHSPPSMLCRALLVYFYSYFVLGILLHCNFLPWT